MILPIRQYVISLRPSAILGAHGRKPAFQQWIEVKKILC